MPQNFSGVFLGASNMIKFNKFNVTNGTDKAKVHYSLDNRTDGRTCVTIYAKDYDRSLGRIFDDEYTNNSDSQTDYFEKGRVVLFDDHPLYAAARAQADAVAKAWCIKMEARRAVNRAAFGTPAF
jgi:hypothetical protein